MRCPLRGLHLQKSGKRLAMGQDAGVGHQDIHCPQLLPDVGYTGCHRGEVGGIEGYRQCLCGSNPQLGGHRLGALGKIVVHRHSSPLTAEGPRNTGAHATPGTGNQCHFPAQIKHDCTPLPGTGRPAEPQSPRSCRTTSATLSSSAGSVGNGKLRRPASPP